MAAIESMDSMDSLSLEQYDLMQKTMLRSPFHLSKLAIAQMRKNKAGSGVIGNMACVGSLKGASASSAFHVVKAGLRGLSRSIAAEGRGKIRSFFVSTALGESHAGLNGPISCGKQRGVVTEAQGQAGMTSSRGKEMSPVDVANLFLFGFSRYSQHLVMGDLLFAGAAVLAW
jgi:3-hydroxybutyrate dehydrogenase